MKRILEPELMEEDAQAKAYAEADFAAPHSAYIRLFLEKFPDRPGKGFALDFGCGAADVTLRFARACPGWVVHAVDGSVAMLKYARRCVARSPRLKRRVRFIRGLLPGARIPWRRYDVILATSFLHHLHDPQVLWQAVRRYAQPGTIVLVADLRRPRSRAQAQCLVEQYSGGEPEVLRRDFRNSLLAAFTPAEVRRQLREAGLAGLKV